MTDREIFQSVFNLFPQNNNCTLINLLTVIIVNFVTQIDYYAM